MRARLRRVLNGATSQGTSAPTRSATPEMVALEAAEATLLEAGFTFAVVASCDPTDRREPAPMAA